MTPFMLFYTEHRDAVKARRPAARPEEISKEVSRLWLALGIERTRKYCLLSNLYAESLVKHRTAAAAAAGMRCTGGNGGIGGGTRRSKAGKSIKRKTDARLPKLPVSSFMWFSRHHRAILRNEHQELSFCEIGKTVGALWKAATAADKRPFEDLAAEARKA